MEGGGGLRIDFALGMPIEASVQRSASAASQLTIAIRQPTDCMTSILPYGRIRAPATSVNFENRVSPC